MLLLASIAPAGASAAVRLDPVGTFTAPVFVSSLPGDPGRVLVVEQRGTIQLVDHGVASTFLDLDTPGLVSSGGERGLLSVALAPDYPTSHRLYVFSRTPTETSRSTSSAASGDTVPLSSRRPLLTIPHPGASNHNGGQLQFGPDGMLYAATGDGGGGGDPNGNAQNLNSLLGKMLRIDPRRRAAALHGARRQPVPRLVVDLVLRAAQPLAVLVRPHDGRPADRRRRPEPVRGDRLPGPAGAGRGANFGWDCREAFGAFSSQPASCDGTTGFIDPIYADEPPQRRLRDRGRLRRPRREPRRPVRALRL